MGDAAAATRALEHAVERAYETFASCEVGDVDFCTCCHTRIDSLVAALRKPDRHALGVTAVAEFFEDVYATASAGDETFKALLPRVLELATPGADEIAHLNVANLGRKLALARWDEWPTEERAAVDTWAHAWFTASLACGDPHGTALEDVLCALGYLYDDLAPFLSTLRAASDPAARKRIAHLVLSVCFALSHARAPLPDDWSCIGARWRKGSRPERQMLTWLATHASHARLIADATANGCRCVWVRESTAAGVDAALAAFAVRLVESVVA